jgi:2-polyprenyl-6-hydroxyphenyl methylase / 3-demethylubiquinone-9 3-methyltransferase
MQQHSKLNIDPEELAKFKQHAQSWWDPKGTIKSLHDINPLRLGYIEQNYPLKGTKILDVGCGGGLLSEAMAKKGAAVVGVDANESLINVAKLHALESELCIDYQTNTAEQFALENKERFELITCLELLEHVPDPASLIASLSVMLKPQGKLVISTVNRNPKSFVQAIVAAEHFLRLVPKGTHEYKKFIKPSELSRWCEQAGLEIKNMKGMTYNPLSKQYRLTDDVSVNYLAYVEKI